MYGDFKIFEFEKGKKYPVPTGYGFTGDIFNGNFNYDDYEYVGPIEQIVNHKKYLVFKNKDKYVFCDPTSSVIGNRLRINLNPKFCGTLKSIQEQIGKCKWDLFCTKLKEKEMPNL